ncbi:DUF4297 domain-containing protein [Paenibacillus sp. N3/727]|uniref:dsDNA nuclease domain-containing protein n=1 Tax=Paenibacillus sp. N3/727 TaxID=2925845 RepID=UPI001F532772|nr:dsDNA nuclease domain-containing protein [Paenibacillus sp. N3/727]UNK19288.1 DUF4297 domain-containing protein [Paenibacillus sp. N3/727]
MKKILSHDLREKAGSDSYNRFDYQVHWIVYHMINQYRSNSQFLIFCEYHDDMAKLSDIENPHCAEFFQIKTAERYSEWTLSRLTKTTKKRGGVIKHSFLGFIFYNFMQFESDCSKCHFVSNIGIDTRLLEWQALIEDDKIVKTENPVLYEEIKTLIKNEYQDIESVKFEETFDNFIQNTFIYDGDLTLQNYEKVVAGEFFNLLENDDLYTSNSNKILKDIIEIVRKKSKTKIDIPISFKKLSEKKGISSDVFSAIKSSIKKVSSKRFFEEYSEFLDELGLSTQKKKLLLRELKVHRQNLLNVEMTLYQDVIVNIIETLDKIIIDNYSKIDDIPFLQDKVFTICDKFIEEHTDIISTVRLEAIFYERLISEDATI